MAARDKPDDRVRLVVYLKDQKQRKALQRLAEAWAKAFEDQTGVRIKRPVSAYLRSLIDRESKA